MIAMRDTSANPALLYFLLKVAQLIQWLLKFAFPLLCHTLDKVILCLEKKQELASTRNLADTVVRKFIVKCEGRYQDLMRLEKLGSRSGRYWYRVTGPDGAEKLLTLTPVSEYCPLKVEDEDVMSALNALLHKIDVPLLHGIEEVAYMKEFHGLVVVQPFSRAGSLKDLIHQTSPTYHWKMKYGSNHTLEDLEQQALLSACNDRSTDWNKRNFPNRGHSLGDSASQEDHPRHSAKLCHRTSSLKDLLCLSRGCNIRRTSTGRGLSIDKVASYGRQILKSLLYLRDLGFPYCGHVTTSNVILDRDSCRLGGYENTLLRYKPHLHGMCPNDVIDIVMFGHVIYEMACGRELPCLVPSEDDLGLVTDLALQNVLEQIFHRDHKDHFTCTVDKICVHPFFQCVRLLPHKRRLHSSHPDLTDEISTLLSGKPSSSKSATKNKHLARACTIQ